MKSGFVTILLICVLASFLSLGWVDGQGSQQYMEDKVQDMATELQDSKPSNTNGTARKKAKAATLDELNTYVQELEKRLEKSLGSLKYWMMLHSLRGKDGRDGRDGAPGAQGPPGAKGNPGKDGILGKDGLPGKDGGRGPPGPTGPPGPKGQIGANGLQGIRGPPGAKGDMGKSGGSVTYVRWGKTTCQGDAVLVYTGRIGGEHYNHKGGGAGYVCLPNIPKYGKYKDGWQSGGRMYGTEYHVSDFNPFKKNLHDHDAPCAVCYVQSRGTQIMTPARDDCSAGWTREYHGYLMTAHYAHVHSSSFICVDEDAEYVPGTQSNQDGALLYPVQGVCGALPCKPYVNAWQLTCAVCTK